VKVVCVRGPSSAAVRETLTFFHFSSSKFGYDVVWDNRRMGPKGKMKKEKKTVLENG
jgi:hypothetical protein